MPDPVSLLGVARLEPGIDCLLIKVQILEAKSSSDQHPFKRQAELLGNEVFVFLLGDKTLTSCQVHNFIHKLASDSCESLRDHECDDMSRAPVLC